MTTTSCGFATQPMIWAGHSVSFLTTPGAVVFPLVAVFVMQTGLSDDKAFETAPVAGEILHLRESDRVGQQFASDSVGRTKILGLSGKPLNFHLEVIAANHARLGFGEIPEARQHRTAGLSNSPTGFHLSKGDIFPYLGKAYEIVGIQYDANKTKSSNSSSVSLRLFDSAVHPPPRTDAYVISTATRHSVQMVSRRVPQGRIFRGQIPLEKCYIRSWRIVPGNEHEEVAVKFQTVRDNRPKPPQEGELRVRRLRVGDTFTELGVVLRLDEVQPATDLEDGRRILSWLSFSEVGQEDP